MLLASPTLGAGRCMMLLRYAGIAESETETDHLREDLNDILGGCNLARSEQRLASQLSIFAPRPQPAAGACPRTGKEGGDDPKHISPDAASEIWATPGCNQ